MQGRARLISVADLAAESPASLLALPGLRDETIAEVLGLVVREWAGAVLASSGWPPSPLAAVLVEGGEELADAFTIMEEETPDFDLLRRHLLAAEPRSLRRLGAELGVSGECVRLREKRARQELLAQLNVEGSPVASAVEHMRDRFGPVARVEELDGVIGELDGGEKVLESAPDRRALLLFLGGYEVCGDWAQSAGLDHRTDAVLAGLTEDGPAELGDCLRELSTLGIRQELSRSWIEQRPGFVRVGGRVARDSQVMEVPIAILRAAEEPLGLRELFARTEPPMCFETFRSHILRDERFMQRGVRRFGLAEWGEDRYTTLVEKMSEEIDRNDGAMQLDALVQAMGERFEVAEGSVLHRARTPRFEIDSDGRISRCIAPLVVPPTPLALTRNCFRLEAGWAMKVRVTPSLLRGTNTRMPLAFAIGSSSFTAAGIGLISR